MTTHPLSRRTLLGTAAASTLAAPAIAQGAPVVLRMSSWLPPVSIILQDLVLSWTAMVETVTRGAVRVEILEQPLGPPPAHHALVTSGEADLVYSLHGYSGPDAFLRAQIGQFSFLGDAYKASHAFASVYLGDLEAEAEHPGMELLGVFQHGPGVLMLKDRRVLRPRDFEGLRIRHSGGYIASLLESLGAEPVALSPLAVAGAMDAGEIDGAAFPYEAAPVFGLSERINHISELEGGYYNASWFIAASEPAWARIDPDLQALIKRVSLEQTPLLAAKAFDLADATTKRDLRARGVVIDDAMQGSAVWAAVEAAAAAKEAAWSEAVGALGFDGPRALDRIRARRLEAIATEGFGPVLRD